MKFIVLFVTISLISCNPNATDTNQYADTPNPTSVNTEASMQLEQRIQMIIDSSTIYISDPHSTFNITAHTEATTQELVHFINNQQTNPENIKGLEKNATFENISTYSYGYWSGGTRGFITYSILTVQKDNRFYAANISSEIEARFDSIIPLNDSLFLLLGGDKAYSSAYAHIAYMVKITDTIDIHYPAFINRPFLNFYNGAYTYNQHTKQLMFQGEIRERIDEVFAYPDKYRHYANDSVSSVKLYEMIRGIRYDETKSFVLQFNGKHFERLDAKNEAYL
ncbi:MAG TPA: hypothetical protein PLR46_08335 [Ferruginibacter sp.]|nr:hypothetical protein [Ferruginibacter sp.]